MNITPLGKLSTFEKKYEIPYPLGKLKTLEKKRKYLHLIKALLLLLYQSIMIIFHLH